MGSRGRQIAGNALAFALLFAVSAYRQLSLRLFPHDPFRTYVLYACYVVLCAAWAASLVQRVTQREMRAFLLGEDACMLTGLTIRFVQDTFLADDIALLRTTGLYIGLAASDDFTQRELDVMRALATGSRYEDIAEQLHLSTNTVKYHVKNILQKTGFRSTVQLVAEVVESRFVLPKY